MNREDVKEKFRDLAMATLQKSNVEKLFERLINLEHVGDVTEVIPLLIR